LFDENTKYGPNYIGIINTNCDVKYIVDKAISNINFVISRTNYNIVLEDIVKITGIGKLPMIEKLFILYYI